MIASFGSPPTIPSHPRHGTSAPSPSRRRTSREVRPPLMATCSRAPLSPPPAPATGLAGPGMKGGPSAPAPEEEEVKPPASDLARPGKRFRARVPMTKEEEEKLVEVTVRHMAATKELRARTERRDELRGRLDEVLFKRRCWAATMANHVLALRARVAHGRHQLRVGCKEGEPLPEELEDARRRIRDAFVMNEHIGRAMDMGLDAFADDYCKFYEDEKMRREVEAEIVCGDENEALRGPVASN